MTQPFQCQLVTPEAMLLEAQVDYVDLPAHDGQVGLMHLRAPLVVKLGVGKLRLDLHESESRQFLVDGGFAEMKNDKLVLLTDRAIPAEQINLDEARAALREAESMRGTSEEAFERRQHDLALARTMVDLAGG
jgi:F-type H+-transporting ATPase subunit epsilon